MHATVKDKQVYDRFGTAVPTVLACLKELRAKGQIGATVDQIAAITGRFPGQIVAILRRMPDYAQDIREGKKVWMLIEDWPHLMPPRDEILRRIRANFQQTFARELLQKMRWEKGVDAKWNFEQTFDQASDAQVRHVYGVLGPLKEKPEEGLLPAGKAGAAGKGAAKGAAKGEAADKEVKEPRSGGSIGSAGSWPFRITREEEAAQLAACERRRADYWDEIEWASANMGNWDACPKKAPSNRAWHQLVLASSNLVQRGKFLDRVERMHIKRERERKEQKKRADDLRKQFALLDAIEAEFLKLDAAKADSARGTANAAS